MISPEQRPDAFVSYSPQDRDWVCSFLLPALRAVDLYVVDSGAFEVGEPELAAIERLVDLSAHTIVVLTPAWLRDQPAEFVSLLTQTADPAGRIRKLLPVLLKPVELPLRYEMLAKANFTDPDRQEDELARLIDALEKEDVRTGLPAPEDRANVPPKPVVQDAKVGSDTSNARHADSASSGARFAGGRAPLRVAALIGLSLMVLALVLRTVSLAPDRTDAQLPYYDDFSDGLSPEWRITEGTWRVSQGALQPATSGYSEIVLENGAWSDCAIDVDVNLDLEGVDDVRVYVRRDAGAYIYFSISRDLGYQWVRRTTRKTQLVRAMPDTPMASGMRHIRIEARGDRYEAVVTGQNAMKLSTQDDRTPAKGAIALGAFATTEQSFEDVTVVPLD